jgi:hypothetical protein
MWEAEKIEYIFALLRKWRWNFKKLLEIVYDRRTERQFVQHFSECDSFLRDHDSAGYIKLSQDEQERVFYSHIGWEWIIRQLRAELEELTNLEVFGPFSVEKRMENINLLENIVPAVELKAPHLCGLLQSLDHPATAKKTAPKVLSSRHILMMSMMCMSLHRKKCSNLPTSFGIYMLDGGANKRVISTSNRFGICSSYSQLRIQYKQLASRAEQEVRALSSASTNLILSYDTSHQGDDPSS